MTWLLAPLAFIAHLSPLLWYAKLAYFQASAASRSATSRHPKTADVLLGLEIFLQGPASPLSLYSRTARPEFDKSSKKFYSVALESLTVALQQQAQGVENILLVIGNEDSLLQGFDFHRDFQARYLHAFLPVLGALFPDVRSRNAIAIGS